MGSGRMATEKRGRCLSLAAPESSQGGMAIAFEDAKGKEGLALDPNSRGSSQSSSMRELSEQ